MTVTEPIAGRAVDGDAQALFEEARRRRRRRRTLGWVVFFAAGVTAATVYLADGGHGRVVHDTTPGRHVAHPSGPARVSPPRSTPSPPPCASPRCDTVVLAMGLLGPTEGWAATDQAVYLTSDRGSTWTDVTPALIADQQAGTRADRMAAVGSRDLWLPVEDVVGLVPFSESVDGSDRGEGIERSTDGGAHWTFTALPGCLQSCGGDIELSFPDALHGFAVVGPNGGNAKLFATADGGGTWAPVSVAPFPDSDGIVFTDASDGWALGAGGSATAGQVLYRTTDGGAAWRPAPGLPAGESYDVPTFFGTQDAVVVGRQVTAGGQAGTPIVYTTTDGGTTWSASPPPAAVRADANAHGREVRFSAPGFHDWVFATGASFDKALGKTFGATALYRTSDAGRTWTVTKTALALAPGAPGAPSLAFFSGTTGWAFTWPGSQEIEMTTDGGTSWRTLGPTRTGS